MKNSQSVSYLKLHDIFESFIAQKACIKKSNLTETDFFVEYLEMFQSFKAPINCLKNSIFLLPGSVHEITWNISKFQSSNIALKKFILLSNQLRLWNNVEKIAKFQSSNFLLEIFFFFLRNHSTYQITWTLSDSKFD